VGERWNGVKGRKASLFAAKPMVKAGEFGSRSESLEVDALKPFINVDKKTNEADREKKEQQAVVCRNMQ
jgi:hypothetical protein